MIQRRQILMALASGSGTLLGAPARVNVVKFSGAKSK